jgi:hypothetical protein
VHSRAHPTNLGSTQAHDHHTRQRRIASPHIQHGDIICSPNAYAFSTLTRPSCEYWALCLMYCASGRLRDTSVDHVMRPGATVDAVGKASISYRRGMHVLGVAASSLLMVGRYHDAGIYCRSWASHRRAHLSFMLVMITTTGGVHVWMLTDLVVRALSCRCPGGQGGVRPSAPTSYSLPMERYYYILT